MPLDILVHFGAAISGAKLGTKLSLKIHSENYFVYDDNPNCREDEMDNFHGLYGNLK